MKRIVIIPRSCSILLWNWRHSWWCSTQGLWCSSMEVLKEINNSVFHWEHECPFNKKPKSLYSLSANMGDKMKHRKAIWSRRPQFDKCFVPWWCHPAPHLFTSLRPLLEPYSCSQGHVVSQVREQTQVNKKIAWWGKKGHTGFQSSSPHKERYQHKRGRRGRKDSSVGAAGAGATAQMLTSWTQEEAVMTGKGV